MEPKWRSFLNWAAVVLFFTLPIFVFILHILSIEFEWLHLNEHVSEFKYLREFYQIDSMLVFGLAGLNTVDQFRNGKIVK